MAGLALPNRPKRHEKNHGRQLAQRRRRPHAGRLRTRRAATRSLRSADRNAPESGDANVSRLVQQSRRNGLGRQGFPAHLWFVTVRPFDDGNGRIARAIADMGLARSERSWQRFYSMSAQIRQERSAYYDHLEQAQRGTMDITNWMAWFFDCLGHAIEGAQTTLATVLVKARFWSPSQQSPSMSARYSFSIGFWTDLRENSRRQNGRSWGGAHKIQLLAIFSPSSIKVS